MLPWRGPHQPQQQQQAQGHPESSANNLSQMNENPQPNQMQQQMQMQMQQGQQPQSPTNVQQQQPGGGNQVPAPPVPSSSAQAPMPPAMSLSHVLHFLQTEFRKYERNRNEWEIERGEMRARIALLEGEHRGNENARNDLVRRVRMLEFALKGERSKYLALAANQQQTAGSNTKSSQKSEDGNNVEAPSPTSSDSVPTIETVLNGAPTASSSAPTQPSVTVPFSALPSHVNMSRPSSAQSMNPPITSLNGIPISIKDVKDGQFATTGSNAGGSAMGSTIWNPAIGRDAKGRAKSRDYLKQCLQEISYLTSAATLNPLSDRSASGVPRLRNGIIQLPPSTSASAPMQPSSSSMPPSSSGASYLPLAAPASTLTPFQLPPARPSDGRSAQTATEIEIPASSAAQAVHIPSHANSQAKTNGILPPLAADAPPRTPSSPLQDLPSVTPLAPESDAAPPASTFESNPFNSQGIPYGTDPSEESVERFSEVPDSSPVTQDGESAPDSRLFAESDTPRDESDRLTAIFRPESKAAWRAKLNQAGMPADVSAKDPASALLEDGLPSDNELASLELPATQPKENRKEDGSDRPIWKPKKVLRSHLDAVRSVAFARSQDLVLASAGDDCTVKLWRLSPHALNPNKNSTAPEVEPQVTYRGHSEAVTAIAFSSDQDKLFSASLDQTVHVWALPPKERETYAPFDPELKLARLEGHSDAIWDLAVIPLRIQNESLLATASADGTVKVWNTDQLDSPLRLSWRYNGTGTAGEGDEDIKKELPTPTSVSVCWTDMRKIIVAYSNSVVKLFDVETGKEVLKFKSDETYDGTSATQVNQAVSHPTLPILVTAHEDKYIRFFDLNTGECTHSMLAHLDAVISIDLDPAGLNVVSGGHDCSLRFWDLLSTRTCVQELATHRLKGNEGILAVKYHPLLPYVVSSGADGIIKLFSL